MSGIQTTTAFFPMHRLSFQVPLQFGTGQRWTSHCLSLASRPSSPSHPALKNKCGSRLKGVMYPRTTAPLSSAC